MTFDSVSFNSSPTNRYLRKLDCKLKIRGILKQNLIFESKNPTFLDKKCFEKSTSSTLHVKKLN